LEFGQLRKAAVRITVFRDLVVGFQSLNTQFPPKGVKQDLPAAHAAFSVSLPG